MDKEYYKIGINYCGRGKNRRITMKEYVNVERFEDDMCVTFYIEHEEVMEVASKMEEINADAYMNGDNWEAFFNYYLKKYAPEILEDLDTDPEAGMYSAFYPYSEENEKKANKFGEIISNLIENPGELYRIVEEEGNEIEWD